MTTLMSVNPWELVAQHREALVEYARRALVYGEFLDQSEADDLAIRMQEYMAVGTSFKCTKRELVMLLYRGLFRGKRGCDCFTCKTH